jgi:hypothetical protein
MDTPSSSKKLAGRHEVRQVLGQGQKHSFLFADTPRSGLVLACSASQIELRAGYCFGGCAEETCSLAYATSAANRGSPRSDWRSGSLSMPRASETRSPCSTASRKNESASSLRPCKADTDPRPYKRSAIHRSSGPNARRSMARASRNKLSDSAYRFSSLRILERLLMVTSV